jgi:hypothetical protein
VRKVKYFTKATLIAANHIAIRTNRNRTLYPEKLGTLPQDLKFPVGFSFPHNDCELRVAITLAETAAGAGMGHVWLDIPFDTYNALPEVEVPSE